MKSLKLFRNKNRETITTGDLFCVTKSSTSYSYKLIGKTVEPKWQDNKPNVSCIPDGEYECERYISPKFGETFIIKDVDGRTNILFHCGNEVKDTEGCILTGLSYNPMERFLCKSKAAFKNLMNEFKGLNTFKITILTVK